MDPTVLSGSQAIEALKALADITDGGGKNGVTIPNDVQVLRLEEAYRQISKVNEFELGDLVCLKPSLGGSLRIPSTNQPGIVTKRFEPPLIDDKVGSGDSDFGRKFDVAVLVFVNNERCVEFAYDSRVLQPWEDRDAKSTAS